MLVRSRPVEIGDARREPPLTRARRAQARRDHRARPPSPWRPSPRHRCIGQAGTSRADDPLRMVSLAVPVRGAWTGPGGSPSVRAQRHSRTVGAACDVSRDPQSLTGRGYDMMRAAQARGIRCKSGTVPPL